MVHAVLCQQGAGDPRLCNDCHRQDASRQSVGRCGCVEAGNVAYPCRVAGTTSRSWHLGQTFIETRRLPPPACVAGQQSPIESLGTVEALVWRWCSIAEAIQVRYKCHVIVVSCGYDYTSLCHEYASSMTTFVSVVWLWIQLGVCLFIDNPQLLSGTWMKSINDTLLVTMAVRLLFVSKISANDSTGPVNSNTPVVNHMS